VKRTLIGLGLLLICLDACQGKMQAVGVTVRPTASIQARTPTPDLSPAQTATDWAQFQVITGEQKTETAPATTAPNIPLEPLTTPQLATSDLGSLKVAYYSEGKILAWDGGRTVELADQIFTAVNFNGYINGHQIVVSDDGEYVAYPQVDGEIWSVRMDGGKANKIFGLDTGLLPDDVRPYELKWVPGTHILLVNTLWWIGTSLYSPAGKLFAIDVEQGTVRRILNDREGSIFFPSPDGAQVAAVQPDQIRVISLGGGTPQLVFQYQPPEFHSEGAFYPVPIWAPDSKSLVVAIPPQGGWSLPVEPTLIWQVPADRQSPRLLAKLHLFWRYARSTVASVGTDIRQASILSVSPDLTHIAYVVYSSPDDPSGEVHVAKADGTGDHKCGQVNSAGISWSPDSKEFVVIDDESVRPVVIGDVEGNTRSLAVNGAPVREARWISNQDLLLLVGAELRVYRVDSGASLVIGEEKGLDAGWKVGLDAPANDVWSGALK
jgi:hypothetical protein